MVGWGYFLEVEDERGLPEEKRGPLGGKPSL